MANISLIAHTENPEKLVAAAAKLCYSQHSCKNLMEKLDKKSTEKFIDLLMELGHESPLEHVSFTFAIEGISRACLAQITRHRIASFSVQSQRYVKISNFEFVIPPEIEIDPLAKSQFLKIMQKDAENYASMTKTLYNKYFSELMLQNKDEKKAKNLAEKKAIEDARFLLPNACKTNLVCTFNARSLLNFFKHRGCNRAQWEIREVAQQMLQLCFQIAPNIFKNAGPGCLNGKCPEGKMTCGKQKEIKAIFEKIKGENK